MDMQKLADAMAPVIRKAVELATAPLLARLAELEQREPIPGRDGIDGTNGRDGADAPPVDAEVIKVAVIDFLHENPPAPGKDGVDGKDGKNGENGVAPTVDEVAAGFERRFGEFLLTGERRFSDAVMRAIDTIPAPKDGRDGVDGKDGRDGLELKHFTAKADEGGRVVLLTLQDDERTEHVHLHFPVVLDKGYWKDGTLAEAGDGYTFGGSYWIAQKDTDAKPETGTEDWRLAVRKGRDGKDGGPGPRGERGLPGAAWKHPQ